MNTYSKIFQNLFQKQDTSALFIVCSIKILILKLLWNKQEKVQLGLKPVLVCSAVFISDFKTNFGPRELQFQKISNFKFSVFQLIVR